MIRNCEFRNLLLRDGEQRIEIRSAAAWISVCYNHDREETPDAVVEDAVVEDAVVEDAVTLRRRTKAMWTCQTCSEAHEDSFDTCWNCGSSKGGAPDPSFPRGDQERDQAPSAAFKPVCPQCNSPMVVGHISLSATERAQLDWTIGPEESDEDPTVSVQLMAGSAILGSERTRRAHRCTSCGIVTIEFNVLKCGYCGRTVPASTETCSCGWTHGEKQWDST